jgi:hypothetical protein
VTDAPQRVKEVDFGGLHPEALFATGGRNEITVLSDDGNDSCKDQNLPASGKSFRGLSVTLPEPGQRR